MLVPIMVLSAQLSGLLHHLIINLVVLSSGTPIPLNYYFLALYQQNATGQDAANVIKIFKNTTLWTATPIKSFTNLNFAGLNSHYPIKVVMEDSTFSFYLNGVLLGTHTDASHASGKVGYRYDAHGQVLFF